MVTSVAFEVKHVARAQLRMLFWDDNLISTFPVSIEEVLIVDGLE